LHKNSTFIRFGLPDIGHRTTDVYGFFFFLPALRFVLKIRKKRRFPPFFGPHIDPWCHSVPGCSLILLLVTLLAVLGSSVVVGIAQRSAAAGRQQAAGSKQAAGRQQAGSRQQNVHPLLRPRQERTASERGQHGQAPE
jgi:hypothetical protein